ncbi:505_t:CDS:2 [Ambispora gerdemannii]|uniref:505_t:CDS:1 n=1 Tax=Ambispora gerdemannii TaxID=144530 RepID=A0A9N9GJE3_9GLOM|nr:505_t:CDS:2 [Ambispora gerdemannii]
MTSKERDSSLKKNQHNMNQQNNNRINITTNPIQSSAGYLNMAQSITNGTNNILNNQSPTLNVNDNNILKVLMDAYR